jgi:hypothetical protein
MLAAEITSVVKQIPGRIRTSRCLNYGHGAILPLGTAVDIVSMWTC